MAYHNSHLENWQVTLLETGPDTMTGGRLKRGQLAAYRYRGFWQAMDTLREKNMLEAMWQSGRAPWKI